MMAMKDSLVQLPAMSVLAAEEYREGRAEKLNRVLLKSHTDA